MYLLHNLEEQVLSIPYNQGYRHLRVLSGYVSPIFVQHVLEVYSEIQLEITIGMVSTDGLAIWNHQAFKGLMNQFPGRLEIFYQVVSPGNHRKVYHWKDAILADKVFIGSANFTQNGFWNLREILVESTFPNINDVFSDLNSISCDSPNVEEQVRFYRALPGSVKLTTSHEHMTVDILSTPTNTFMNYVDLSLIDRSTGQVPARSGLNWGQRQGRNHNQAYLSVPLSFHNANPTFFPPLAERFLVITDDGENLICVMAQQNRKGIHTSNSNSIMGAYFRRRLGLGDGAFITLEDLHHYGRDSVRIFKMDNETYYLDFSV
ncbi:restriction endonuclease PLD domain-containing protein [Falsibacillus pallidus]|uniref:NgoFVII restriction endonuclease n=1 Tax=Falsibacillus pallidus TaxID=493781 RepID=A0A370GAQ4_9BACI|nr:restriction endonuclease PLD domain-containing protein [Falsibacillus pallidus]RDI40912.1 NgoFVII restriction endonuclease [Falsibacillus pallidus]